MKPLMPDRAVARKLLLLQKNRQYKVKADRENSLSVCFFVCPVPSGLPHRSHCVPININRCGYRVLLELLGRFELPTSSLPTTVEPSSPCCIRLCGGFLSKKDEVAVCLFHCFRPLISPCGSRCGSNNFQDANEGRTSASGKPSRTRCRFGFVRIHTKHLLAESQAK